MRELVLGLVGLTHSTYEQPLPKRWAAQAATGHPWKGNPVNGKFHTYPEMAAAGLWTTAGDLATLGVELLNILHGKTSKLALTKATIESMLQPQLPHQKVGIDEFVGLGFFCNGADEAFQFGHAGGDEGFVALLRIYKNVGKGAVIMLNSNEGWPLLEELMQAIGKEYQWPGVAPKATASVSLTNPRRYVGQYASKTGEQ